MSILNEVRESISQQPGPFYSGDPSSSMWGRSTGFWRNSGGFDFGFSSPASNSGVPPPPIEVLRFEEPPRRAEVFIFGANLTPEPDQAPGLDLNSDPPEDVKNDHATSRVEVVGTMLNKMRIENEAGDHQPSTTRSSSEEESFSKNFTVGSGSHPRPRFSKLRKSTHQVMKGKANLAGESPASSPAPEFIFKASSEAPSFHTGEPSSNEPPVREEKQKVADDQARVSPDNQGFNPWCSDENQPGSSSFVFTAMRDSVSVIPEELQELSEDARSVAENLNSLKLDKEIDPSSSTQQAPAPDQAFVFGVRDQTPAPAPAPAPEQQAFVFGGQDQTPAPAPAPAPVESSFVFRASGSAGSNEDSDTSFVFKASGDSFGLPKKKKEKIRRVSSRSKPVRSRSASVSDESQGSPMDFSPCPETGARLSPPTTGANSDSEGGKPRSSESEVENLRAAASELNLGKEPGDLKREDEARKLFSFTSSSTSEAPRRRLQRRGSKPVVVKVRRPGSSSSSSREGLEMELDQSKPGVWSSQAQMMDFSVNHSGASSSSSSRASAEQACEKWRLRGNQAYANGDFPKAEEYYSRGASSVPSNETSQSCIHASMLCYSNRAATRMVVGRMREALADCKRAISVDPNFLRVRLRAGSCFLALGESEAAATYFKDCLYRVRDHDRNDLKIASEASEGLRKSQQAQDYYKRVWDLISENEFIAALRLVNEALAVSPFSEGLLELKARCLISIRKFEEAVEMCEQTLVLAESNWPADPPSQLIPGFQPRNSPKVWRSWVISKSFFYLGRLEDSVDSLQKLGDLLSLCGTNKISQVFDADTESYSQFHSLLHGLLQHKAAGNEAFQAGRHTEAVENYTAALACNSDARPFNAVLFCNRAAAYQALGNIADAIADSSRAVVLDSKYAKAISRRATLHTLIRDYGQACIDLRRLTSLLESQAKENHRKTGQELKQARERLASAEEELKRSHSIDHYVILGLDSSCSAADIKKAYRKLALRHHPDKAGQRSDVTEDGSWWKEAAEEIRNDAERLFKLIGEAYNILSDPAKRSRYDQEEELRKLRTRSSGMNSSANTSSESYHRYHHSYERSGNGRRQRDPWSGYSHQHQRWQSGPDAAQPDTYARYFRTSSGVRSTDYNWDDL